MAREQRKLAAIVAADVVGYSRLMGRDESGTVVRLRRTREQRLNPILARRGGRIVKLTGDGAIIEFASAVEALSAAIEFQQSMAEANRDTPADDSLLFRLGVHLGDLIVEGEDLYGDGVNVAARLEGEATAGGIVVSGATRDFVGERIKARFADLGELSLKNIERPMRAWRVEWDAGDWLPASTPVAEAAAPAGRPDAPLPLPDKPSIAVLPFQNMSGDPEQEYFADGMVEEIITGLSRFKSLFVVARNSTFAYKGKSPDIRTVGRELGVRYVLEGSVRRAGNRIRITGQLIDAASGTHLWADRFDGSLEDVFDLQDRVMASVVGAVAPKVDQAEIERAKLKPAGNLDAYDCLLRGLAQLDALTDESWQEALRLFYRALELDPDYSTACGMIVRCYSNRPLVNRTEWEKNEIRRLASRISAVGPDDALALCHAGFGLFRVCRDEDAGVAMIDRGLSLNQNLAVGWNIRGWVSTYLGQFEMALEQLNHALRLSPLDPETYRLESAMAFTLLFQGKYEEAAKWASRSIGKRPTWMPGLRTSAAANALAGNLAEARSVVTRILQLEPEHRLSYLKRSLPWRPQDADRLLEGLRLAGLPE